MPSPCPSFPQLLRPSPLTNLFPFDHTNNGNCNKIRGYKHAFMPLRSTTTPLRATLLLGLELNDKTDASYPSTENGITSIVKHKRLPVKREEQESLDIDGQGSRLQVQNFVYAIKALPCEERIDVLNILKEGGGIWSTPDFNDLLMALVLTDEIDIALKLYSNVASYSLVPDSWTFSIVIRCLCKKNDEDEAKTVLDHMIESGFNPNVATFTTLVDSFCKTGQLQKAFNVFGAMESVGCRPTIRAYNCLLKGLCYVGRVEEAFELLQDIKKTPLEPDIYTYTVMMDGFCKVGRSDEAMELLNEALEMGLTPTVVTFNTLFNGYTKEGRPVEGIGVLKEMKQRNCKPDYITYRTLLHGLLIWGKIRVALTIYKEMTEHGFEVDKSLMNNLVRGLCRESLKHSDVLEDACQVFEKMKKEVFIIDQSTYCLVIRALCTAKKGDNAFVNLQQMIRSGYAPRLVTINRVIRALCDEGKVYTAVLVLILTYESYKFPSRLSYELLINEFNRQGRSLNARSVYGAALVRGVLPERKPRR